MNLSHSALSEWDNLNEIERLSKARQHMEYVDYRNENVREAFKDRFITYLTAVLEDGNRVSPDGKITLFVGGHQPDEVSNKLTGYECLSATL